MQDNTAHLLKESKSGELTPSELVRKHILDPNHVVTDEELRNVKLELAPVDSDTDDTRRR